MDLQTGLVAIAFVAAFAYLARAAWKTWAASGCVGGCGCGPKPSREPSLIRAKDLLLRVKQPQ